MAAAPSPSAAPSVSAVMVTYHTGDWLLRGVERLLAQPELGELVLVDNGNPASVRAAIAARAAHEPRLLYRPLDRNLGFAAATNLGVREARCPDLLLINPDSLMPPGGLGRFLTETRDLPRPWLAGCRVLDADGRDQRGSRRGELNPASAIGELRRALGGRRARGFNRHEETLPDATLPMATVSGACMLMPTEDYRAVGGLDEGYFLHVEDIDFCLQVRRAGGGVYFVPGVALLHRKGSSAAAPLWVEWQKTRGFARYFAKNFTASHGWLVTRALALAFGLRFLLRAPLLLLRSKRPAG
jgi:GT2 family glycosyltransferase